MPSRSALAAALLALVALAACEPSCKATCRKVVRCDLDSTRISLEECEASCVFQERLYDDSEDERRRDLLVDHKQCLRRSSCDEIAGGACYEPDLFTF
jgi:hypothetical protein